MPAPLDDRGLEILLSEAGYLTSDLEWLRPLAQDLRTVAAGPVPSCSPTLATLLSEGFPAPAAVRRMPVRNTKPLARVTARLAGLGLVAKLGLGVGVAAASVTGAGAVGALPAPVQHAVATAVGSATPFSFPDPGRPQPSPATKAADDLRSGDVATSHDATRTEAPAGHPGAAGSTPVGASAGSTGPGQIVDPARVAQIPASVPAADLGDGASTPSGAAASPGAAAAGNDGTAEDGAAADGSAAGSAADDTPAAGHVPTSLPAAADSDGSQGSKAKSKAESTPAADHRPAGPPGLS